MKHQEMSEICECCHQPMVKTRSFDEAYANYMVVWDKEANDIAEEDLYAPNRKPELNSWEVLKVYKFLADDVKGQIKRYYQIH